MRISDRVREFGGVVTIKAFVCRMASATARPVVAASLMASVSVLALPAHAQSVWDGTGMPGAWNDDDNWTPAKPALTETAIFAGATPTTINVTGAAVDIGAMEFTLGAPAYTFNISGTTFRLDGVGIVNSSSNRPTFNNSSLMEFANSATAANAILNNSNFAIITFADSSNAGSATITNNGGATYFGGSAHAGTSTINVNANAGLLFFSNSDARDATVTVQGTSAVANGQVQFMNASHAGNATMTANAFGGIFFQDTASARNATITVNNDGVVAFAGQSTGGNARFIINSGGWLDLIGLDLGFNGFTAGSIEGAGTFCICDHLITVGSNNLSTEVTGLITGTNGALTKVGTGTLTLSGIADYTGATTVNGGKLVVNTSLVTSSSLTVNAGGTIGGSGTLPNTTINGGTLSPGNSIGTITIAGNLVLTAASTYLVEVSPTAADRTNVTGTATLGGATVSAVYEPGSYVSRQYTILNATGGRTGTFGSLVNTNLPRGFAASLSYDANNAYLDLVMAVPNFGPGLTINQINVASALANSFNTAGGIPLVYGTLTPNGLTQASGEVATQASTAAFQQNDYFLNLMLDPFVTSRGGAMGADGAPLVNQYASEEADAYAATRKRSRSEQDAYAAMARKAPARNNLFDPRWSVWGAAYGGELKADGNAAVVGSHNATTRAYGFAVGADYRLSPDTLLGFAISGGESRFSLSQNLGSGRADVFQAGVFARHNIGSGYIKGALAYGWHDVDTDRIVTAAGIDKLTAKYDAHTLSGRIEGGYRFVTPWMGITPYVAGQAAVFWLPSYSEQVALGANNFALNYASKDISTSRTELGVRTDKSFVLGDALLTLRGRAAWAHYNETDRALFASFQALPASGFTVFGAAQARNVALVSASAETKWRNGFSIAGVFEGEFSDRTTGYAGKGVLRYQW
jgi:autotransporter-associated beta strand protein